mmetsp:Transcript_55226/g.91060  ORF Transcript_55226/g.91060 Transcript_55226/m.91060 type:complete len:291 (-) Transcript_55226:781-1653(-)
MRHPQLHLQLGVVSQSQEFPDKHHRVIQQRIELRCQDADGRQAPEQLIGGTKRRHQKMVDAASPWAAVGFKASFHESHWEQHIHERKQPARADRPLDVQHRVGTNHAVRHAEALLRCLQCRGNDKVAAGTVTREHNRRIFPDAKFLQVLHKPPVHQVAFIDRSWEPCLGCKGVVHRQDRHTQIPRPVPQVAFVGGGRLSHKPSAVDVQHHSTMQIGRRRGMGKKVRCNPAQRGLRLGFCSEERPLRKAVHWRRRCARQQPRLLAAVHQQPLKLSPLHIADFIAFQLLLVQ